MRLALATLGALLIGIPFYVLANSVLGIVGNEPEMSICFVISLLVAGVLSYWGIPHLGRRHGKLVKMMAGTVRKAFGALSLLMGLGILGWAIYNLFYPTEQFRSNLKGVLHFSVPIAMISVGWFWLTSKTKTSSLRFPCFAFARILDPIGPWQRVAKYEEPLSEALRERGFGEVEGGGTSVSEDERIEWVGLDIYLTDFDEALQFTRLRLHELGAPQGSVLEYKKDGEEMILSIG